MNGNNKKIIYLIPIYLKQKVKINRLGPDTCKRIASYIGQIGVVKGRKTMNKNQTIFLVEFEDYNRVWVKSNELEYL